VVGAVFLDQVFELVMGVDERVEIDPLQVGRRHPADALAAIRARRGGVVDAAWISRQKPAAMRDHQLEIRIIGEHAAKDQVMQSDCRI
jgi:hypothetical protein